MDTDRNLLVGVLALQADLLDSKRFVEACVAWTAEKDRPLADLLLERGWITPADRRVIEHLLELKLKKHDGDPRASLAEALDDRARACLSGLGDPGVHQTLATLPGRPSGHVLISTIDHTPGTRERYKLARLHAKGGIGQVWLARDETLGREVALKELRPERAASPAVRARFLEEAKITGQLEHPGIVPVYELTPPSDHRRPFYTMRFVRGRTLAAAVNDYHRRRAAGQAGAVEFRGLLQALVGVGNAVAYAHSRGVLHRDLKPQNVVLGDFGEVIVLDWGLAKLVDRPEETLTPAVAVEHSEGRAETVAGQALGTPAYMAPEQAEGRWDRVDRRSDVYGLGAILYEVLAGRPPFEGPDTADVLRKVAEESPERPRQHNPEAPHALEAVCLKALAKRPAGRYATAMELAQEVQRFLADEPVAAWREPVSVRARRWARRHRTAVTTAAALLVAGLVGISAFAAVLGGKNRLLAQSYAATKQAETEANQWLDQAMAAIEDYYRGFSEEALKGEQVPKELRERLLAKPVEFYEELTRKLAAKKDPSLRERYLLAKGRFSLARILSILGRHDEARRQGEAAVSLCEALAAAHPGIPEYQHGLASSYHNLGVVLHTRGEGRVAQEVQEKAIARYEALVAAQPGVPEYQDGLASSYASLGGVLHVAGEARAAHSTYEKAIARYEALVAAQPDVLEYQRGLAKAYNNLGLILERRGQTTAARTAHAKAIARYDALVAVQPNLPEHQYGLATSYMNLGTVLRHAGEAQAAREAYEKAIAQGEALVASQPGVPMYRVTLAGSYMNLGTVLRDVGEAQLVREAFEKAIAQGEALVASQPGVPEYQDALAMSYMNLGNVLGEVGEPRAAREAYEKAIAQYTALVAAQPGVPGYQNGLALSCMNLGILLGKLDEPRAAQEAYERAIARYEALVAAQPRVPEYRHWLGASYMNFAACLDDAGEAKRARPVYEQAIVQYEALLADQPNVPEYQVVLAKSLHNLGKLLNDAGDPAAARQAYEKAIARYEALLAAHPGMPDYEFVLAQSYRALGIILRDAGDLPEARQVIEKAIPIGEKLTREHPEFPDFANGVGAALNDAAAIDLGEERFDRARDRLLQAIAWQRKALAARPNHPIYRQFLSIHLNNLIRAAGGLGDTEAAAEARRELAALRDEDPAIKQLDARLAAVTKGEKTTGNAERLRLAYRAHEKGLYAVSARLFSEALQSDPKLGEDRQAQHRYNAACAAALAAAGRGEDEPRPDDAARVGLRRRAHGWLKAELATWPKALESGAPEAKATVAKVLRHWQEDTDLDSVRDAEALARLPEAEREEWQALWAEVEALCRKAES
jgi:serine/threonine-protein kinase